MPFQPASPSQKPAISTHRASAAKRKTTILPIPIPINTGDPLKDLVKRLERLEAQLSKVQQQVNDSADDISDLGVLIMREFSHLYSQIRLS